MKFKRESDESLSPDLNLAVTMLVFLAGTTWAGLISAKIGPSFFVLRIISAT